MSDEPLYLDKANPDVQRPLLEAVTLSRRAGSAAGLGRDLLELVNVRVSQINGCVACLGLHVPMARKAGVPQRTLDLLPAWREAGFGPQERAALELAEAITSPREHDLAAARTAALEVFSREAVAALEWAAVLINTFNRISIANGHPARRY